MSRALTPQIELTVSVLQKSRNPLAAQHLVEGLSGPPSPLRQRIVQALVKRNDAVSRRGLIEHFDQLDVDERKQLEARAVSLRKLLGKNLSSDRASVQRAAVSAVCHFGYIEHAAKVAEIALEAQSALSAYTQDQLLNWATRLGAISRLNDHSSQSRVELLQALQGQLESSTDIPLVLLDAILACLHWDDSLAYSLFADPNRPLTRQLLQALKRTTRRESMEFLAGFLFRKSIPHGLIQTIREREDIGFGIVVGEMVWRCPSISLRKNAAQQLPIPCLSKLMPDDRQLSVYGRGGAWLLHTIHGMPQKELLDLVLEFIDQSDSQAMEVAEELLRWIHPLDWNSGTQLLSDPQMESLALHFRKLLRRYRQLPRSTQLSVARLFPDYQLELFMKFVSDWEPERLRAAAQVIRALEPDWEAKLQAELQSPAPTRRQRAAQSLTFFGIPSSLKDILTPLMFDENDGVRTAAIAAVDRFDHPELIEVLKEVSGGPSHV